MPIIITSSNTLSNIEQHFKVSAGPGAGKTYWLSNHIRNVLQKSKRLGKARKISCITYTNIAVETILKKLGNSTEQVEVSTIHSFLYKHVVKPYLAKVANVYNLDFAKVDGHDEYYPSNYSLMNQWKIDTSQRGIQNDNEIINAIKKARWKFDASQNLIFEPNYPIRVTGYGYPIKMNSYLQYKKLVWEKGILHHDDVLFFSYQIIKQFPFVLDVLRAKFPYFFIDEFQDSNPIQVEIVKLIAQNETIVGVIGDLAQSIYGFQGANSQQFTLFQLSGMQDYLIEKNRRSSNEIIGLLNQIRTDITQQPERNVNKLQPKILIGQMNLALRRTKAICQNEEVVSLSRKNITSNAMKREITGGTFNSKLIQDLQITDPPTNGNKYRSSIIINSIQGIEFAREGKFKDALKAIQYNYKSIKDKYQRKKEALNYLAQLTSAYNDFKDGSIFEFYQYIKQTLGIDMARLNAGRKKTFYESNSYQDIALCVNIPEDQSLHKTIHKSKGDEFDNVLLVFENENDFDFILSPDLLNKEEHRVNYVAISRASNRLFITVPSLSPSIKTQLSTLFIFENV